ncbi:MAG TPA: hypothetical protein VG435_17520 [Acidimicrobiales bacterium]|jgi:hypothetical protein|nr:hypothetical protein [Acidimicrobiales bacterium]
MAQAGTDSSVARSLSIAAVAVGAIAGVAPKLFAGVYGLPTTGPFRFLTRLWGTRTATLGAMVLLEIDPARVRRLAAVDAVMNAVDVAAAVSAGPDVTTRTKVMAAVTSGSFALALAAVAAELI